MQRTALDFEVVNVPEQTFAFVVRRVEADRVGEFITGAIERVAAFAGDHGGLFGPPMAIASAPDEQGAMVVEVGWPVAPGTAPVAPVEVRRLPATRAAVHRHVGEYEELSDVYGELFSALLESGLTPTSGPRERYVSTPVPGVPPVTEIVWPVAS